MRSEIDYIEVDGHFDFRRVMPWDYEQTQREFQREIPNINLPKNHELHQYGNPNKLWILLDDYLEFKIWYKGVDTPDVFRVKRGFMFDKATIPIFKDNKRVALIGLVVHDLLFGTHAMGFHETNELFFKILRCKRIEYNGCKASYDRMCWLEAKTWVFFTDSFGGKYKWDQSNRPLQKELSEITLRRNA